MTTTCHIQLDVSTRNNIQQCDCFVSQLIKDTPYFPITEDEDSSIPAAISKIITNSYLPFVFFCFQYTQRHLWIIHRIILTTFDSHSNTVFSPIIRMCASVRRNCVQCASHVWAFAACFECIGIPIGFRKCCISHSRTTTNGTHTDTHTPKHTRANN